MIWSQGSPDHPSGFFSASFFKCASDSSSVTEGRTSDTAVHTERVKPARPAGSQPLVLTRWGPSRKENTVGGNSCLGLSAGRDSVRI